MISEKFLEVDGINTYYIESTPASTNAPTLLFIHGLLARANVFERIIDNLANDYKIVALDLPGNGASGNYLKPTVSYALLATFIKQFCTKLGIDKAIVCGHSMGGAIAITLSALYPDLVTKLILMNSICYKVQQPFKVRFATLPLLGPFIFAKFYRFNTFLDYYLYDVYFDNTKADVEKLQNYYNLFNTPQRRSFNYKLLKMVLKPKELTLFMKQISAPTLLLWGDKDKLVNISYAEQLQQEIKGSKLQIIPDCGHPIFDEKPDKTSALMLEFIK